MSEKKYISYNYLGHLGRFGNQMFQYAAFLGIAKYHEYDYFLPPNTINHIHLYECFELDNVDKKIAEWFTFSFYIKSKIFFGGKKFSRAVCLRSVEISLQKMVKNHQETYKNLPLKKESIGSLLIEI